MKDQLICSNCGLNLEVRSNRSFGAEDLLSVGRNGYLDMSCVDSNDGFHHSFAYDKIVRERKSAPVVPEVKDSGK